MLRSIVRQEYFCDQVTLINTGLNKARRSGTEREPEQERRQEREIILSDDSACGMFFEMVLHPYNEYHTSHTSLSSSLLSRPRSKWMWKLLSYVGLFATLWSLQSVEFSRPEYWSGVGSCSLLQGISPTQGSNPRPLHCRRVLQAQTLTHQPLCQHWEDQPFSPPSLPHAVSPCVSASFTSNQHPLFLHFTSVL